MLIKEKISGQTANLPRAALEPVHDLDQGMQRKAETGEKASFTLST